MKKILVSLVLILALVAGAVAISHNESSAKAKPTVLCISAPLCSACREFDPIFSAAKAKFSQKFNFVKEDVNSSQRAKSLNVTETPSVFILDKGSSQKIDYQCLSNQSCFEQKLKNY